MWTIVQDYLQANNIIFVNTLPYLQGLLVNKIQPYKLSTDGHPNHFGHQAIVKSLQEELLPKLSIH